MSHLPSIDQAPRPGKTRRAVLGLWWPVALVLLVGLVTATLGRRMLVGGVLMTGAFLSAAAGRAFLPEQFCGGLHVRSRALDVVMWLGCAVLVLGAILAVDFGPVRR